jgi:UDP-3-O-[3-hydroxymyristoyl] N-acetylglucosamine deacetylase
MVKAGVVCKIRYFSKFLVNIKMQQITLKQEVKLSGVGLHSGNPVTIKLIPAEVNTGIVFKRVDIKDDSKNIIPARYDLVKDTRLCTMLINDHGISIGTIEHLMSALSAFLIDNLLIEVDAPEVPILDGSALEFVQAIKKVGLFYQMAPKKVLRIIKPVEVVSEKWKVKLVPSDEFILDVSIDFGKSVIKSSSFSFDLAKDNYENLIAKARTFCFAKDIEYLRSVGLAKGGSLENAVVVDDNGILNHEGLRYEDEFVRHKLLDAIGDLYLGGYYIKGHFIGEKCGHEANNQMLRKLMQEKDAFVIEEAYSSYDIPVYINTKNLAFNK